MTNSKTSEPLEICWRVIEGSSTRILTCAIFGACTNRVELRVGYFVDVPLHSQEMPDIESARVLAQNWLDAVRATASGNNNRVTAITVRCLDCNQSIETDPWWYDPSAVGINVGPPATTLTGFVSQRPDPPTPVSAPFHKTCLERQMGRIPNDD
jgi:hypothetical protein